MKKIFSRLKNGAITSLSCVGFVSDVQRRQQDIISIIKNASLIFPAIFIFLYIKYFKDEAKKKLIRTLTYIYLGFIFTLQLFSKVVILGEPVNSIEHLSFYFGWLLVLLYIFTIFKIFNRTDNLLIKLVGLLIISVVLTFLYLVFARNAATACV